MNETTKKMRVLFVCTHNSARSQLAEGLTNALHGYNYEAHSAGTEPSEVNPRAVLVLLEMGIDITHHRSQSVREFLDQDFDYVITVCDHARETCPVFPGNGKLIHHSFADPAAVQGTEQEKQEAFRKARDEIKAWLETDFIPKRGNRPDGI